MPHALAGLLTGLTLIVAVGAQNAFVLRQGLRREHVGVVVALCAASDVVLIAAGVAGLGALVDRAGALLHVVTWAGVAFLVTYAALALRRAARPGALAADVLGPRQVVGRTLALTWLNPHVYLDTVLLLGGVAAAHGSPGRWWFGAGAVVASVTWFTALGFGARLLAPLLARPRAWQVLDVAVAVTMLAVAASLVAGEVGRS